MSSNSGWQRDSTVKNTLYYDDNLDILRRYIKPFSSFRHLGAQSQYVDILDLKAVAKALRSEGSK